MALKISVVSLGDGWAVRSGGFENDMMFAAGAKAEAAARDLARRYAQSGAAAGWRKRPPSGPRRFPPETPAVLRRPPGPVKLEPTPAPAGGPARA